MRIMTLMPAALMLANGAIAATGYNATLAQALSAQKVVVIDDNLFRCNDSTCILASPPTSSTGDTRTCRALQRKVGALTSYVVDGKAFDPEKLAKCNAAS
jgi:hypothetical protein